MLQLYNGPLRPFYSIHVPKLSFELCANLLKKMTYLKEDQNVKASSKQSILLYFIQILLVLQPADMTYSSKCVLDYFYSVQKPFQKR